MVPSKIGTNSSSPVLFLFLFPHNHQKKSQYWWLVPLSLLTGIFNVATKHVATPQNNSSLKEKLHHLLLLPSLIINRQRRLLALIYTSLSGKSSKENKQKKLNWNYSVSTTSYGGSTEHTPSFCSSTCNSLLLLL